ncbi:MAG: hypothetical protein ACJA0Q_000873 [Saprospiraceae bacterium]|jgi:hypothetical protein
MAQLMFSWTKNTLMKQLLTLLTLFCFMGAFAQKDSLIYSYEAGVIDSNTIKLSDSLSMDTVIPGTIKYFYNTEIDSLIEFQKNFNIKKCPKTVKGFRVQIYSCSGISCQEKANKNYNQFLIAYPEIPAEKIWDPPSYKVRVGNCRNRFEAEQIKSKIKEDFPFIFIVPDFIDSPFKVGCKDLK